MLPFELRLLFTSKRLVEKVKKYSLIKKKYTPQQTHSELKVDLG
jgi:hypothetical protein